MTFRRLTNEELAPLEKKFIQFLVSHTITGDDWAKMKERRPEQAMGLIDIFSDLMFEEAMKKVQFLLLIKPNSLKIYHCKADKIALLGLKLDDKSTIDFTKEDTWLKELQESGEEVGIINSEKEYAEPREVQIFKMIEIGCRITDSFLHDTILKSFNLNQQNQ